MGTETFSRKKEFNKLITCIHGQSQRTLAQGQRTRELKFIIFIYFPSFIYIYNSFAREVPIQFKYPTI